MTPLSIKSPVVSFSPSRFSLLSCSSTYVHLHPTSQAHIIPSQSWPSPLALIAAFIVTSGFFAGVVFDPDHASSAASAAVATTSSATLGIMFGALSSAASAGHAVLIKRGLVSSSLLTLMMLALILCKAVVEDSPITLAYYNNVMSSIALIPMVFLTGELPGVLRMLQGADARVFFWGAGITVSLDSPLL